MDDPDGRRKGVAVPAPHKHNARRAELISATRRVAGRSGLNATNVRAVAAEASVSAGSVLYYLSLIHI